MTFPDLLKIVRKKGLKSNCCSRWGTVKMVLKVLVRYKAVWVVTPIWWNGSTILIFRLSVEKKIRMVVIIEQIDKEDSDFLST
jgi:hypothetical protein